MVGRQTVHGCRSLVYAWAKNIDHDGEPLKRDLISAALCHKSRDGKWMMYTIAGTYLENADC